jgi:hypothetical protein
VGSNPTLSAKIKGSGSFAGVFFNAIFPENMVFDARLTTK